MKKCAKCGIEKPPSDFRRDVSRKAGLQSYCKPCSNAAKKAHAKATGYRTQREWRLKNPDYLNTWVRERRPDYWRIKDAKRRAIGNVKDHDVRELLEAQRWRCVYCEADLRAGNHVDHVMPIALGGTSDKSNLQMLCPPCNLSKGPKHPEVFQLERRETSRKET